MHTEHKKTNKNKKNNHGVRILILILILLLIINAFSTTLLFRATDGRHNTTVTFTVLVTDVIDESPVVTSGAVTSVPEELAVGTPVAGLFAVEDRDQGDSLTYTLRGGQPLVNYNGKT